MGTAGENETHASVGETAAAAAATATRSDDKTGAGGRAGPAGRSPRRRLGAITHEDLHPRETLVCIFAAMLRDPAFAAQVFDRTAAGPLTVESQRAARRIADLHHRLRSHSKAPDAGSRKAVRKLSAPHVDAGSDCEHGKRGGRRCCGINPLVDYVVPELPPPTSSPDERDGSGWIARGHRRARARPGLFARRAIDAGEVVLVERAFAVQAAGVLEGGVANVAWTVPPEPAGHPRAVSERGLGHAHRLARRMLESHGWAASRDTMGAVAPALDVGPGDPDDLAAEAAAHRRILGEGAEPLVVRALSEAADDGVLCRFVAQVGSAAAAVRLRPLSLHVADAVFPVAACAAHACRPNAQAVHLRDCAILVANTAIAPGDRITVNRAGLTVAVLDGRRHLATRRCVVRAMRGFDCFCDLCAKQLSRMQARHGREEEKDSPHEKRRERKEEHDDDDQTGGGNETPPLVEKDDTRIDRAEVSMARRDGGCPLGSRPASPVLPPAALESPSRKKHALVERACIGDGHGPTASLPTAHKLRLYESLVYPTAREHLHVYALAKGVVLVDPMGTGHVDGGVNKGARRDERDTAGAHDANGANDEMDNLPDRSLGLVAGSPFVGDDHMCLGLLQWFAIMCESSFTDPEAYGTHLDSAHSMAQCLYQALLGDSCRAERRRLRWSYAFDATYFLLRVQQHRICIRSGSEEPSIDALGRSVQFLFCIAAKQVMPLWLSALCLMASAQYDSTSSVLCRAADVLSITTLRHATRLRS